MPAHHFRFAKHLSPPRAAQARVSGHTVSGSGRCWMDNLGSGDIFATRCRSPPATLPRPRTPFKCPIYRSQVYLHIGDSRDQGPIFECAGCSVMFRDPERFTRFEPYTSGISAPDFSTSWKSSTSRDEK